MAGGSTEPAPPVPLGAVVGAVLPLAVALAGLLVLPVDMLPTGSVRSPVPVLQALKTLVNAIGAR